MFCDCDVFVYSVFVFYFKMACFISSCPVTDLESKKCICMYVCTSSEHPPIHNPISNFLHSGSMQKSKLAQYDYDKCHHTC
jgi:hypothetical protein